MEDQDVAIQQPTTAPVAPMSWTDKIANLFAAPGELFDNVRLTPPTVSNWLIPLVVMVVIALLMSQLVTHNASLADQIGTAIKHGMQQQVDQGKMTQDQLDQTYEMMRPGSFMFTIGQVASIVVMVPAALFLVSLLYWLIGRSVMKASAPYMKVVEVVGLTLLIGVLESLVTTLMMFARDSIHAGPSLAFFISEFDTKNKLHMLLSKMNLFTFWSLALISIGLSRLFQRDLAKVAVLVVALWVLWTAFTVLVGFGG